MKAHEKLPLLPIARGEGVWLEDFEGKRYLDGVSSWWVNLFGHNEPRIKAAISEQLNQLEHVMLAGFTHEPVVQLSEKLGFKDTYAPLLKQSAQMPSPDSRLAEAGETAESFALRCAEKLEAYVALHHQSIAAFIIEPLVQCAAGMGMYHPVYLKRAREICDQYQVHLIADEIAVGFGRTGTMFACEQAAIRPDFICLSKGITGGYLPLSVVLTTDAIYQAFYDDSVARGFLHSHSYTGNALACSAALATLRIFEQDKVLEK
ncbi:MAG: aminotransferase class III-fold pyridoxal phosphate-dependent enzyme, partial [Methylophilaceae bacterium]|nr:aminotransferase class III-fold pyridoxal phosphate-dependent enzyme [Methylophilaceae bacterium]